MIDPRAKYETALAAFAAPGARWANKGSLTYWGKAAGLTAEEIIGDARAAGVTDRDADIRRGWNDARPQGNRPQGGWRGAMRTARPKPPPTFPRYVRGMVAAGGDKANLDDILALSPYYWPTSADPRLATTVVFMQALFASKDLLYVFRDDMPTAGKPGENIRPAAEWANRVKQYGSLPGDLVVPNPFTGERAKTADGKQSFISQSCLAAFPFMVLEFDEMPLARQCAFWRAFILTSNLAPALVALTFSGNRSIHGLVHVGCTALADWQAVQKRMRGLFASDPDETMRADVQAMRPRTGTRIPGVRRLSNGNQQRLLYLNTKSVWTARIATQEHPYTRPDRRTGDNAQESKERATAQISGLPCDSGGGRG